jgi:hypothetical protein
MDPSLSTLMERHEQSQIGTNYRNVKRSYMETGSAKGNETGKKNTVREAGS